MEPDEERIEAPAGLPLEVRIAMALNGAAAGVFLVLAIVRLVVEGGSGLLPVPIFLVLLAGAAIAVLYWRPPAVRLLFGIAVLLPVVLHLLIAMGNQVWWLRTLSGVLAAAYLYSVVLVNTKPARIYLDGLA